ncbi:MAG: hypothetical protein JWM16_305, partial [Verrucomicrobiales bacterium]|nr:hypothetical protein [Verrucomicrobiales bacterium]
MNEASALRIEPRGGEDAALELSISGSELRIDLQAKSSCKDVALEDLALWYCHFGDRQATSNLLSTVLRDDQRLIVFVVGGRCRDDLREFLVEPGTFRAHEHVPLVKAQQDELAHLISEGSTGRSALAKERQAFCRRQASAIRKDPSFQSALRRTLIWEQLSKAALIQRLRDTLVDSFSVPKSRSDLIALHLVEKARIARDQHADLLPALRVVLNESSGSRIFRGINVSRGFEHSLEEVLRRNRVLLLSGQTQCGKSHYARFIAQVIQNDGGTIESSSDVNEAARFLSSVGSDVRLFLLEDPFGHLSVAAEGATYVSKIRDLINKLGPNRFLIVTSRADILAALPSAKRLGANEWIDLTVDDPVFLGTLWEKVSGSITAVVKASIAENIQKQPRSEILQPGHLVHLSALENISTPDFNKLCRLARFNSQDLATEWMERGGRSMRLHAALALVGSTTRVASLRTLRFMLSCEPAEPGVRIREIFEARRLGVEAGPPPPFPAWPKVHPFTDDDCGELAMLERRHQLVFTQEHFRFSHPDYREASVFVLLSYPLSGISEPISLLRKAFASLDCDAAKSAVMMARELFREFTCVACQMQVVECVLLAANSIFPAVKDRALATLALWMDHLPKDTQEKVLELLKRAAYRDDEVLWNGNTPWFNPSPTYSMKYVFGFQELILPSRVEHLLERILQGDAGEPLSTHDAWALATSLRKSERLVAPKIVAALFAFDEAFIRADTAFWALSNMQTYVHELVDLAFSDEYPGVVFQGVLGCFKAWMRFSVEIQGMILPRICNTFHNVAHVTFANRFIIDFADSRSHDEVDWNGLSFEEKAACWSLWAQIFPHFLATVSKHRIWIDQGHLWTTARKSLEYVSLESGLSIARAWLLWIEGKLLYSLPDTYGFAVAEYLIDVTAAAPHARTHLSNYLLQHANTSFLLRTICDFIARWEKLTMDEREMLAQMLSSKRNDQRWIRAVILTRSDVPEELVALILPDHCLSEGSLKDLVWKMPSELLADCLAVWCGAHPRLDYLGLSYSTDIPWLPLLKYFVLEPKSSHFRL